MRYCKHCQEHVTPQRGHFTGLLWLLCIFTNGFVMFYYLFKTPVCPSCGTKLPIASYYDPKHPELHPDHLSIHYEEDAIALWIVGFYIFINLLFIACAILYYINGAF